MKAELTVVPATTPTPTPTPNGVLHIPAHKHADEEPCAREGCPRAAEVVLGLEIYPPKSVMEFYKTTDCLTRMLISLKVCRECVAKLTFKDVIRPEQFLPICGMVEKTNGTAVDVEATKVVAVEYDDPDYLFMLQQQALKQAEAPA